MTAGKNRERVFLRVDLTRKERARFDAFCGPGRPMKRGAWVREAILAALERDEAARRATA